MTAAKTRGLPLRPAVLLLLLAIAAEVTFLLAIPRYVTVDGASHVAGAAVIRDVLQGQAELHLRYLDFSAYPVPNLLPEVALGIAMLAFDPAVAEKLLQITYVVLLPLSLLYAIRAVEPRREWLALLALPMTFTFSFQFGFYDFSFGLALFLIAAGYLWRHLDAPGWRTAGVFGLLALSVYMTHLVPFLELALFGCVVGAGRLAGAWRAGGRARALSTLRGLLPFALASLPPLILATAFLLSTRSAVPAEYLRLPLQVIGVLGLGLGLVTTEVLEIAVAIFLALTLMALFGAVVLARLRVRSQGLRAADALLAYAVVAVLIACLAPASVQSGGSYIPERLALFPVFGLGMWLASAELPARGVLLGAFAWPAAALALVLMRLPTTTQLSAAAVEYEALAACVAPGATFIQANLFRMPSGSLGRTDPFLAETGRVAAPTRGVDLGNFEGTFPFFLFRNRTDNDPYRFLLTNPRGFGVPPGIDLEAYRARPYGTVDYVLVVGRRRAGEPTLASEGWRILRGQLERDYLHVATSTHGLVEAWERNDAVLVAAGEARRAGSGCQVPAET